MAKQYVPCPACGALGEIGSNCQFCNTTIVQKEGVIASDSRLVEKRTITPRQYAEKISIYHEVYSLSETYSKVEIGDQEGIINLNGDLIFPLERRYGSFSGISSSVVALEGDKTIQYYNLNSFEKIVTNKNGFIEDKNDPKKLHYLDPKNWTIKNEYINHKGETKTYDYAEILDLSHLSHKLSNCKFYIFHQENSLSLCLIEEIFPTDNTIEYLQKKYLNKYIIFLEGIKAIGKLEEIDEDLFLSIEIQNEEKFKLKIATLRYSTNEYELYFPWDNWLNSTDPLKIKERKKREEKEKRIKQQEEEQQRKYLRTLKIKRSIATFLGCIGIWVIYITIENLINMPEDGNSDYHIFYIIGGGLLALIAFGLYDSTK